MARGATHDNTLEAVGMLSNLASWWAESIGNVGRAHRLRNISLPICRREQFALGIVDNVARFGGLLSWRFVCRNQFRFRRHLLRW